MDNNISKPNPRAARWLDALQASGYRLTGPRRAVVEILAESECALNAASIYDLALERTPSIGLVTIYRTLEKLEELELIQRVHHPDGCHAYIAGFTGHQHLLLCQDCGRVAFFHGDDIRPLIARVEGITHFTVQEHWLQLFGLCENCREGKPLGEEQR